MHKSTKTGFTKSPDRAGLFPWHGSLTVEAAFVLPLFLFAMLVMLGFFTAIQTQVEVTKAAQAAARTVAAQYGTSPVGAIQALDGEGQTADRLTDAALLQEAKILARRQIKTGGCWTEFIKGGAGGVSFAHSSVRGSYVNLRVAYKVKLPVTLWGVKELPVRTGVYAHKWIGYTEGDGKGDANGAVYVTPYGRAYHSSPTCRYLDLHIQTVSRAGIRLRRNRDGGKYYPCSCYNGSSSIYITNYGTEYHSDLSCSHLTRQVSKVSRDQVGSRHPCKGCMSSVQ